MEEKEAPTRTVASEHGYHVMYIYADSQFEWNCSQWRMLTPSDAINRAGGKWKAKLIHVSGFMFFLDPAIQDLIGPADLIILQRNIINEQVINAMLYWQGMGKPVVIDLDDAYQMLPWSNSAKQFWHLQDDGDNLRTLLEGLRLSDGLVSPNRLLLSDLSPWTRGYYLQNYADRWWLREDMPTREEMKSSIGLSDRLVIGWGGSLSHYDSWWGSGLLEAVKSITNRHPEVVWMICGSDKRVYDLLDVPSRNKYLQGSVPPVKWPEIVHTFDIGVAPLFGSYDQRRSWIKGIEYLLAGVPWIGQEGEVYRDIASLGTLIPPASTDWENALEYKIGNLNQEREAAASLIPQARDLFVVDNNLDVFYGVYSKIIQDFSDDKTVLPNIIQVAKNGRSAEESTAGEPGILGELEQELAEGVRG